MADPKSPAADPGGAERKAKILELAERTNVKFMRLQFTDILGVIKNVEIPNRQFASALDGQIMFDGSSIEGFVRIEESDMYLRPDLSTFRVLPGTQPTGERIGRLICDIHNPDGSPFEGCPRHALKRAIAARRRRPATRCTADRRPSSSCSRRATARRPPRRTTRPATSTSRPVDLGEDVRRQIVLALESIGIDVEAAHHEVAAGQHEIDFRQDDVLTTADNVSTFRFIVKNVAQQNGLHATFMPKPVYGSNGSGLHLLQSLVADDGQNAFLDLDAPWQLSRTCLNYIAGLLRHAKGFCSITNPLVNSYKRLVPGFEAPTNIAWSERNRSPLVRVPARARRRHRRRAAHARSVVQPVPRARGHAVRRARRHHARPRSRAADQQEHPQDELPRAAPPADRRAARQPERRARRAREGRSRPGRARPPHLRALPRSEAQRVAGVHRARQRLGDLAATSRSTEPRYTGNRWAASAGATSPPITSTSRGSGSSTPGARSTAASRICCAGGRPPSASRGRRRSPTGRISRRRARSPKARPRSR